MRKLLFLIPLFLFACNRREEAMRTRVHGKVIDKETYEAIPGAPVYFMKVASNGSYSFFDQMVSDANGQFEETFIAESGFTYHTYSIFSYYLINGFVYLPIGQDNYVNILLSKPGYLMIHLKNQNPLDSNDYISLYDSDYYNRDIHFTGNLVDTTFVITHYGNQQNQLKWRVTRNDSTISYDSVVNFISLDTVAFDLFY